MSPLISFSGLASGIDSSALIKATLDQERAARIKPLQNKISAFQDTNDSFSKLKELLGKLNSAAQKLRTVNGGAVAKSVSSSDETVASGSSTGAASSGTYSVDVTQLARTASFSFNDRFSSATTAINSSINDSAAAADRTITVAVGTGSNQESVEVELTSASTLEEFVSKFNEKSTKATASVVNVGTASAPSYAISIASNSQGTDSGQLSVSVGNEIQTAGSGALTSSTLSQALDAQFTLSGINGTITKSTNSISNIIPGLTLNLQGTGPATITVRDDKAATTSKVQEFVNAYNEVLGYIRENDAITQQQDGADIKNIFGPLSNTSVDEGVVTSLRAAFSSSSVTGSLANTLADLGIATQRDGSLKFDSEAFGKALADDPEAVANITAKLGEKLGAVDGTIAQYTRINGLIDVASKSNAAEIANLNSKINDVEKYLSREQETLTARFARLESLVGSLNSQQSALAQILPR